MPEVFIAATSEGEFAAKLPTSSSDPGGRDTVEDDFACFARVALSIN